MSGTTRRLPPSANQRRAGRVARRSAQSAAGVAGVRRRNGILRRQRWRRERVHVQKRMARRKTRKRRNWGRMVIDGLVTEEWVWICTTYWIVEDYWQQFCWSEKCVVCDWVALGCEEAAEHKNSALRKMGGSAGPEGMSEWAECACFHLWLECSWNWSHTPVTRIRRQLWSFERMFEQKSVLESGYIEEPLDSRSKCLKLKQRTAGDMVFNPGKYLKIPAFLVLIILCLSPQGVFMMVLGT